MAVIENCYGRNFWKYSKKLGIKAKLKTAYRYFKAYRSNKTTLHSIPNRYFNSSDVSADIFGLIPKKSFQDIDIFLVACDDASSGVPGFKSSDYVIGLLRNGISKDKIFIVPTAAALAETPLLENGTLSPLCRNVSQVKPVLRYTEYHVTDFCNLKCKGCGHLSNYVSKLEFAGADTLRLSLKKLREKFSNIQVLRIMGGEPLLCRELHEYINTAHEIFPYCQVKIVTNGLLFRNITQQTAEAIRNAQAEIQVTQYPPTRKIAAEITAFCEENGLKLTISSPLTYFHRSSAEEYPDFREAWGTCGSRFCHFLHDTRFFPCPHVWSHSEAKFKDVLRRSAITESEYAEYAYDLTQDIGDDGWDILMKFESPMELCKKCRGKPELFTWESEAGIN